MWNIYTGITVSDLSIARGLLNVMPFFYILVKGNFKKKLETESVFHLRSTSVHVPAWLVVLLRESENFEAF